MLLSEETEDPGAKVSSVKEVLGKGRAELELLVGQKHSPCTRSHAAG